MGQFRSRADDSNKTGIILYQSFNYTYISSCYEKTIRCLICRYFNNWILNLKNSESVNDSVVIYYHFNPLSIQSCIYGPTDGILIKDVPVISFQRHLVIQGSIEFFYSFRRESCCWEKHSHQTHDIYCYTKSSHLQMRKLMRLWYLSHRRPAKAQAAWLRIRTVAPELSLFAHMKYGSTWRVRQKNQTSSPTGWMHMRVWRMSLLRTKSTTISWDGSNINWDLIS